MSCFKEQEISYFLVVEQNSVEPCFKFFSHMILFIHAICSRESIRMIAERKLQLLTLASFETNSIPHQFLTLFIFSMVTTSGISQYFMDCISLVVLWILIFPMNIEKEKLLSYYVRNFERKFYSQFPYRKPLLLTAENEHGEKVHMYLFD